MNGPIDWGYQDVRAQQQDIIYTTTIEQAIEDAAIITSTILIHLAPSIELFDFGIYTFLAKALETVSV